MLDSVRNNANVAFNAGSAFGVDTGTSAAAFIYNSDISGAEGLTKLGAGTGPLILTGTNTYTGGTKFAADILNVGSADALGDSGSLIFTGGTLQYSVANSTDYSNRFSAAAGQSFKIDTSGENVIYSSAVTSAGGSLTKLGAGTLTLMGANSITGNTAVSAGVLSLGTTGSLTT